MCVLRKCFDAHSRFTTSFGFDFMRSLLYEKSNSKPVLITCWMISKKFVFPAQFGQISTFTDQFSKMLKFVPGFWARFSMYGKLITFEILMFFICIDFC